MISALRSASASWLFRIFVGALAIRFAAQLWYGLYSNPETWEYNTIAQDLITGRGYSYRFFGADWLTFGFPAFPVFLAAGHILSGGPDSYLVIGIGLAVMSAALTWVAYSIGKHLLGPTAGIVAAVLISLDPPLVLFAARVHELNLDALLAGAILIAVIDVARARSTRAGVRLGVLAGLTTLARPTIVAFAAAAVALLAVNTPRRPLVIAAAITLAIALPWSIRNAVVLGAVSPTAPYNCVTIWMGNNANATGGPITADGKSVFDAMPTDLRARIHGQPEAKQGRIFCDEASQYLGTRPLAGIPWIAEKFLYFWWFPPHAGLLYPKGWIDAYRVLWAVEGTLALVGFVAVWRRGSRAALGVVALQLVIISASQSLGYVEGRHRLLLEPTLVALAAVGITAVTHLPPIQRAWRSVRSP